MRSRHIATGSAVGAAERHGRSAIGRAPTPGSTCAASSSVARRPASPLASIIRDLRERHRHDIADMPSVSTMRRWYRQARWKQGVRTRVRPGFERRDEARAGRAQREHPETRRLRQAYDRGELGGRRDVHAGRARPDVTRRPRVGSGGRRDRHGLDRADRDAAGTASRASRTRADRRWRGTCSRRGGPPRCPSPCDGASRRPRGRARPPRPPARRRARARAGASWPTSG